MSVRPPLFTAVRRAAMAGLWIMLALWTGCLAQDERLLEPAEAVQFMRENRDNPGFIILDVRTEQEFRQGHIEGAVLLDFHAPDFRERFTELDRDATIFMYCRSGNRSSRVLGLADESGFKRIYDLRGGILAWTGAGLPLVTWGADLKTAPGPRS